MSAHIYQPPPCIDDMYPAAHIDDDDTVTPICSLETQRDDDDDNVWPLQPWIVNNDTSIHYLLHCDTDHGTLVTMMSTCSTQGYGAHNRMC